MRRTLLVSLLGALLLVAGRAAASQEDQDRGLSPALVPLEYLVGRWKGQGVPKDNPALRFRGWTETHIWAWVFEKGKPVGLRVEVQGGKVFTQGRLTFDPGERRYRLEASPAGKPAQPRVFAGTLDRSGKRLDLERSDPSGTERVSLRPNANFVRYTMSVDRKEPEAGGFSPRIEVGLTREGESLGSGAVAQELPRCIVAGGAATLTVSYQGQSYPICCTGCRDEFNENPEKYLKKLAVRSAAAGEAKGKPAQASKVSRFEDAFASDVPAEEPNGKAAMKPGLSPPALGASDSAKGRKPAPSPEPSEKKTVSRAATALRMAQNLDKSGKTDAALKAYRQIVKDYPGTAQARAAAARIKALQ
jgi:YHS domain-containing protein